MIFVYQKILTLMFLPVLVSTLATNEPKDKFLAAKTNTTDIPSLKKEPYKQFSEIIVEQVSSAVNKMVMEDLNNFCSATFRYISGSNFTASWAILVSCRLKDGHHWTLQSYRRWIAKHQNTLISLMPYGIDLKFAVELKCSGQSTVSLPWPIKAKYLWFISVDSCKILDHFKEFCSTEPYGDYRKVIEVTNSVLENTKDEFVDSLMNYDNRSRQFECGSEIVERYVYRNVSKTFSEMIETTTQALNMTKIFDVWSGINQKNSKAKYKCILRNLRYIDGSMSKLVSTHHSHFLTDNTEYPALEYYNFSHSGLGDMRIHFLEWRKYFPKMKYLDLSHNRIKYFSGISDHGLSTDPVGVIDLRHNNITTLSKDDIHMLKFQSETVFIDIRDNPISCDCKLSDFMTKVIKNSSSILLKKYSYLMNLTCATPETLSGRKIFELDQEFCEFTEIFSLLVPVVILSCCLVVLTGVLFASIKYRKEIMILAFTRLNISLPCREVVNGEKKYDAFICYSEQDINWVIYNLLPGLEEPINGPGFKLCIHHRDFPVGGTIFDNIDCKVKESRHTVLVLSNHFLRSTWCKCEFWAAFTESLTQKKRHLVMIIIEDLDENLIEPTMKRCLKTFTYVQIDDRLFWDKIIYALSDKKKEKKIDRNRHINQEIDNRPNEEQHDMDDRAGDNTVIINQMLDGLNNNRNGYRGPPIHQIRDQAIRVNAVQGNQNIQLRDFNIGRKLNDAFAGNQNPEVYGERAIVQDGEWLL